MKALLREARKAQASHGVSVRKKTAVVREPQQAMLATCADGVRGARDSALLLLAWTGGGRRRPEFVGLQIEDLRRLDDDFWLYALGATKTDRSGVRREKPLRAGGTGAERLARYGTDQQRPAVSPRVQRGASGGCWSVQ